MSGIRVSSLFKKTQISKKEKEKKKKTIIKILHLSNTQWDSISFALRVATGMKMARTTLFPPRSPLASYVWQRRIPADQSQVDHKRFDHRGKKVTK